MSNLIEVNNAVIQKDLSGIITKTNTEFKTINDKKLQKINSFMLEVDRATSIFNKTNSQTTSSLMTLTMLESGPYRILRQILAQIEKKRSALKEIIFKHGKDKIRVDEISEQLELGNNKVPINYFKIRRLELEVFELNYNINDAQGYIEGALKEIGAYQERYKEILKNNNIPDDWDEKDFEKAEIEHHIKSIFRNAIRDKISGGCNQGTMEYMEQFGINPIVGYKLVDGYVQSVNNAINIEEDKLPSIDIEYKFLDSMYDLFKDEYKKVLERIGLDNLTYDEYLMKEVK